jgi:hypothetical protein
VTPLAGEGFSFAAFFCSPGWRRTPTTFPKGLTIMYLVTLHTADGNSGLLVAGLTENDVAVSLPGSPGVYNLIRLAEHFPHAEELAHEHILLTTLSGDGSEDPLKDVIENDLEIDQAIENVHVCTLTPRILHNLRTNPTTAHAFEPAPELPLLLVLLGGQEGVASWFEANTERA